MQSVKGARPRGQVVNPAPVGALATGRDVASVPLSQSSSDVDQAPPRGRSRDWIVHRLLLLADVLGLSIAFVVAQVINRPGANVHDVVPPALESLVFILSLPIWISAAMFSGLYDRDHMRTDHSTVDDFLGVFVVVTIGSWMFSAIGWLTGAVDPDPHRMVTFWLLAIGLVVSGRALARAFARRTSAYTQRAIIVGAGNVGQLIARKLQHHPEYGIELVGFVDPEPRERRADLHDLVILGRQEDLVDIARRHRVDRVIIAYSKDTHDELLGLIHRLKATSIHIDLVPRLFDAFGPRVEMHMVEALPLIGLPPARLRPFDCFVKRSLDLLVSVSLIIVTAPLFVYIAWRIKRDSPGPVLFRQTRLGQNMQEFTTLKFRTMKVGVSEDAHRDYIKSTMNSDAGPTTNGLYKLDQKSEVTGVGRWLRKTSLDELPQLINVIRGEMSLVGPRPCIPYETENFAPHHFERFLVLPGLTGLWQVTARARSTFGEALDMDVSYARSWSLGLDLLLLCRTPVALYRQFAFRSTA